MLDLQYVREHPEEVKLNIINRGMDPKMVDIDQVLELDKQHRVMLREVERLRAERNRISGDIGHDKSGAVGLLVQASELKGRLRELEGGLVILEQRLEGLLLDSPNMSAKDVPVGKDEAENVVVKKWGTPPEFTFEPRDHVEIG
ncbi:serine--tRNA ligase, partial [Patescibacteria group bacterium]|nr:serine--tRNA ligase [Patescibacteria group bacterium]